MKQETIILLIGDDEHDVRDVDHHLKNCFHGFRSTSDLAESGELFTHYEPQILLLCFQTIEGAMKYYLKLLKHHPKGMIFRQQVVLLCGRSDTAEAARLANEEGLIDDYVIFRPLFDPSELRFRIGQVIQRMILQRRTDDLANTVSKGKSGVEGVDGFLQQSISNRGVLQAGCSASLAAMEQSVQDELGRFQDDLLGAEFSDALQVTDKPKLQDRFEHLRVKQLGGEFDQMKAALTRSVEDWFADFEERYKEKTESLRALRADVEKEAASVLVVEDDPKSSELLRVILEAEGYIVKQLQDAAHFVVQIARQRPDLVLMDIMMPGMSGIEATRLLKSEEQYREIPVIIVSAHGSGDAVRQCIAAGAADFVVKPVKRTVLLSKIKQLINAR